VHGCGSYEYSSQAPRGYGALILSLLRVVLTHFETVSGPSSCGVTDSWLMSVCCPGESDPLYNTSVYRACTFTGVS